MTIWALRERVFHAEETASSTEGLGWDLGGQCGQNEVRQRASSKGRDEKCPRSQIWHVLQDTMKTYSQ